MEKYNEKKINEGVEYDGNSEEQVKCLDKLYTKIKSTVKVNLANLDSRNSNKVQVCRTIKSLFTSPIRFNKQIVRGVYLACTIFSNHKILLTTDEILPSLEVDESLPASFQTDFHWLMKVANCWTCVKELRQNIGKCLDSPTLHFRNKLLEAVVHLQVLLGIEDLGRLFYQPVKCNDGTTVICIVKYIEDTRTLNVANTKWIAIERLERNKNNKLGTAEGMIQNSVLKQIQFWHISKASIGRGLYLGYLNLKSTMDSINVIVPADAPTIVPYYFIRDNSYVSSNELEWLKNLASVSKSSQPPSSHLQFGLQLHFATKSLLQQLAVSESDSQQLKFYSNVIYLNSDVSLMLILPEIETMCASTDGYLDSKLKFTHLPIQVFEIVNMFAYQSKFIHTHCQLSLTLEMDKILAHRSLRESLSTAEISLCKERINQLDQFQVEAENAWKAVRWVPQVLSWAREKNTSVKIVVQDLYNWHIKYELCKTQKKNPTLTKSQNKLCVQQHDSSDSNSEKSIQSTSEQDSSQNNLSQPAVIRVYAAYHTGLTSGTCVKLHITTKTTTREVIDLVVKQLNEAAEQKGSNLPTCTNDQSTQFCLVAVLGARERCLRDNFCPLQLQNPWSKGWLYVRRKKDLLAAIQQHNAVMKDQVL